MKNYTPLILLLSAVLVACSPPNVPDQTLANLEVEQISQLSQINTNRRFGRFQLQAQNTPLANGKTLTTAAGGAVYLADVPFVSQGDDNTCGQAVMTMLLQYWNIDLDYQTVVNEGNPFNLATSYTAIGNYLSSKGLNVQGYRGGMLENLYTQIQQGQPVIALLNFGNLTQAHYILVVGYNAKRQTIIFHESRSHPYVELDVETFQTMWKNEPVVNLPILGGQSYQQLMFEVSPPENETSRS